MENKSYSTSHYLKYWAIFDEVHQYNLILKGLFDLKIY